MEGCTKSFVKICFKTVKSKRQTELSPVWLCIGILVASISRGETERWGPNTATSHRAHPLPLHSALIIAHLIYCAQEDVRRAPRTRRARHCAHGRALQLWKEGVRTIVRAFHFSCSMLFAAAGIQPEKGRETNISYVRLYGLSIQVQNRVSSGRNRLWVALCLKI